MARRGKVIIDRERCKGCYLCVRACPVKVLEQDKTANSKGEHPAAAAHPEKCIACANCYDVCPDCAITVCELEEGEQ